MNESTIIPEKLQYQLFALRDVDTNNSWRLGDLTAAWKQANEALGVIWKKLDEAREKMKP